MRKNFTQLISRGLAKAKAEAEADRKAKEKEQQDKVNKCKDEVEQ